MCKSRMLDEHKLSRLDSDRMRACANEALHSPPAACGAESLTSEHLFKSIQGLLSQHNFGHLCIGRCITDLPLFSNTSAQSSSHGIFLAIPTITFLSTPDIYASL